MLPLQHTGSGQLWPAGKGPAGLTGQGPAGTWQAHAVVVRGQLNSSTLGLLGCIRSSLSAALLWACVTAFAVLHSRPTSSSATAAPEAQLQTAQLATFAMV